MVIVGQTKANNVALRQERTESGPLPSSAASGQVQQQAEAAADNGIQYREARQMYPNVMQSTSQKRPRSPSHQDPEGQSPHESHQISTSNQAESPYATQYQKPHQPTQWRADAYSAHDLDPASSQPLPLPSKDEKPSPPSPSNYTDATKTPYNSQSSNPNRLLTTTDVAFTVPSLSLNEGPVEAIEGSHAEPLTGQSGTIQPVRDDEDGFSDISSVYDLNDELNLEKSMSQNISKYLCCSFFPPGLRGLFRFLIIFVLFFVSAIVLLFVNNGVDYDILLPRGQAPLTPLTELIRYLVLFGSIFAAREFSLGISLTTLFVARRLGLRKTRFGSSLGAIRRYWAKFLFWTFTFLIVSLLVFDQTANAQGGSSSGGGVSIILPPTLPYQDINNIDGGTSTAGIAGNNPYYWVYYLHAMLKVIWLYSLFLALEKTLILGLSTIVRRSAFDKRFLESSKNILYLEKLVKAGSRSPIQPEWLRKSGLGADRDTPYNPTLEHSASMEILSKLSTSVYSEAQAKHFSKIIFNVLAQKRPHFTSDSLRTFLASKDDHQKVFSSLFINSQSIFYPPSGTTTINQGTYDNASLSIDYSHCLRSIRNIFKTRRDLIGSILFRGRIMNRFDSFLMVMVVFMTVLVSIPFFGLRSPMTYLATLGSLLLGLTFVFGGFAKNIFEVLIFLFVSNPYDIGDTLLLNNKELIVVTRIDLLTTYAFRMMDNQGLAIPTTSMISKAIYNVSRSGFQSFSMPIMIAASTPIEKIYQFRSQLVEGLMTNYRDGFTGKANVSGFDIVDNAHRMQLVLSVEHASSFMDLAKKNKRNNQIKFTAKSVLDQLGITYYSL